MTTVTQHFVAVDDRRVHYRRAGEGPPLVMLHGSPGSSELMAGEIVALADRFTCFALDTPGFGLSDPLPGETLEMADLADATGRVIEALGLVGTRLFGSHTGAAIGLELGARRPDLVAGLILDGVPLFHRSEAEVLFEGYFMPLVADPLGGHLTTSWMRFRDQFTWFPWGARDPRRLNAIDRPEPADIDLWVRMFFRAGRHYRPAYRAACFYCEGAIRAAERLALPTVFMATAEDMLFGHLDRLPPVKSGQSIVRLPNDPAIKYAAIGRAAAALPGMDRAPPARPAALAGSEPALGFIETPGGRLFVRVYGPEGAPPLVILQDAPGSGAGSVALAKALAAGRRVLLPDLPGCGESSLAGEDAMVAAAGAVEAMVGALGIAHYALLARGIGSAVAAMLVERGAPITALLLDGLSRADPEMADRIAPDLPLDPTGAHWIRAWLMVRDGEVYAPWYDGRVAAQRHGCADFDADSLHDRTCEIMKARTTYAALPRAALACDPASGLARCRVPVTVVERDDSPWIAQTRASARQLPDARRVTLPDEAAFLALLPSLVETYR